MNHASKEFLEFYSLLLENRNSEAEMGILQDKDSCEACYYAMHIIKGRFPEAEEFIKKDPYDAYNYAKEVVKGRWPEAEEYIKGDPESVFWYAKNVIKGRWPEAEEIIKNSYWFESYLKLICPDCKGDGVISLGIGGAEEECPKCNGGGFDQSKKTR